MSFVNNHYPDPVSYPNQFNHQSEKKHFTIVSVVMGVAVSIFAIIASNAVEYSQPALANILRCFPIGIALLIIFKSFTNCKMNHRHSHSINRSPPYNPQAQPMNRVPLQRPHFSSQDFQHPYDQSDYEFPRHTNLYSREVQETYNPPMYPVIESRSNGLPSQRTQESYHLPMYPVSQEISSTPSHASRNPHDESMHQVPIHRSTEYNRASSQDSSTKQIFEVAKERDRSFLSPH